MDPFYPDHVFNSHPDKKIGDPASFRYIQFSIRPYKNDVVKNFRKFEKTDVCPLLIISCTLAVVDKK
jgi:hypothetical protein